MRMEHSENFKAVLEEKTREAESIIAAYLPKEEGFAKELAKAMNYSMTAGGKRLRPLLLQESFRLFGGTGEYCRWRIKYLLENSGRWRPSARLYFLPESV